MVAQSGTVTYVVVVWASSHGAYRFLLVPSPTQLTFSTYHPTRLSVNNSPIHKVVGYLDKTFCDVYMLCKIAPLVWWVSVPRLVPS